MNTQTRKPTKPVARLLAPFLLLAVSLNAGAAAQTRLKPGFNLFSPEDDVAIGRQSASEIEKTLPTLRQPEVQEYVSRIGERLAAATEGPSFPYESKVVNVSDVNAFALPGGFMYVHRGLIEAARSEGELAGVMAHEIAHVALRHGTNQVSKAYLAQAGFGILGALIGNAGATGQIIEMAGGFGLNAAFLKFGREAEKQADLMGAQIMARAGYDPDGMSSFFEELRNIEGRDPGKMEVFFSSHPAPADRATYVAQERAMLRVRPTGPVGDFQEVKGLLADLPPAPSLSDLKSGKTDRPAGPSGSQAPLEAPSSRSVAYEHPSHQYRFEHPENWTAYDASSGTATSVIPKGGVVNLGGDQQILCAALFDIEAPASTSEGSGGPFRGRTALERHTNAVYSQVRSRNPYLEMIPGTARRLKVGGRNGLSVELTGKAPTGPETVSLITLPSSDGRIVRILFVVPESQKDSFKPAFKTILDTLRLK